MEKAMKRILCVLFCILLSVLAAGCGSVFETNETTSAIVEYGGDTPFDAIEDGTYILGKNGVFQGYKGCRYYSTLPDRDGYARQKDSRMLWYTDEEQYIPVLEQGNSVIYKSGSSIPDVFTFEAFEKNCDTIGIMGITVNSAGKLVWKMASGNYNPTSTAAAAFQQYSGNTLIIDNINGTPINIANLNRLGCVIGLTRGGTYRIGFYSGTRYYTVDVLCDTTIYTSKEMFYITDYDVTQNGYIIIHKPELMDPGYYDVNGIGIVRYEGVGTAEQQTGAYEPETTETSSEDETLPVGTRATIEETAGEEEISETVQEETSEEELPQSTESEENETEAETEKKSSI